MLAEAIDRQVWLGNFTWGALKSGTTTDHWQGVWWNTIQCQGFGHGHGKAKPACAQHFLSGAWGEATKCAAL